MPIEIKKLPGSEIEITGEISASDFENCRERAIKELGENIKIDGFRSGHIPEKILIEKIGEPALLERMAETALQKEYPKILEENKIQAIGRPEIIITKIAKDNPLGFKIKTAVMPEIELSDYKKIAGEIMKEKEEPAEKEKEKIRAQGKRRVKILEKIIESSKIEAPRIIIEAERNKMMDEMKANITQMGLKWEDYLERIKKKEEELRNDYEKDAEKRVKFSLILNEISEKEKIEVPDEELERETKKITDYYKNLNQEIDKNRTKSYTYGILRNEKVFRLLESC